MVILLMRLSGKRELGQLETGELVMAFMISEVAATPLSDKSVPLIDGITPTITLVLLEVILSFLCTKSKTVRKIFSGLPCVLIEKGVLQQKALKKNRMTTEELLSLIRISGCSSIGEVYYAILEPSGNLSVIPKCTKRPPTSEELGTNVTESGAQHIIISNGKLNADKINALGLNEAWARKKIADKGFSKFDDVFFFGVDDGGEVEIIGME